MSVKWTDRELNILDALSHGVLLRDIAINMKLTERTIYFYLSMIARKAKESI